MEAKRVRSAAQLTFLLLSMLIHGSTTGGTTTSNVQVAVVNDIASHFEVLAGVVHIVQRIGIAPHIFYAGRVDSPDSLGIVPWLGTDGPAPEWHALKQLQDGMILDMKVDKKIGMNLDMKATVVICISAEMAPQVCQEMVDVLQPTLLVLWVHRADTATPTSKILRMHSRYKLVALAPHVAALAEQRLRSPVTWGMPLAPYRPKEPCSSVACLKGFVVQGALRRYRSKKARGFTRNYTALWERMVELRPAQEGQPRVEVCVLGKGGFRSQLEIPPEVDGDVEYLERLPYPEFWGRIYNSYALVPAFGMPVYYESRISSTILASLLTGTPLIADQRLLDTYTFFTPEHVFLRRPDEDEVQAMYRILGMPEQVIMAKRQLLNKLAGDLNAKTIKDFSEMLKGAGLLLT